MDYLGLNKRQAEKSLSKLMLSCSNICNVPFELRSGTPYVRGCTLQDDDGAIKGQTIIEPTIDMWMRERRPNNMVINDPKGELLVKNYVRGTV